jgi:indole-3-glycerol phosphate synthase
MYKDFIIEKSTIQKAAEDDNDDLLLIKNPNTVLINELPSDQDKKVRCE